MHIALNILTLRHKEETIAVQYIKLFRTIIWDIVERWSIVILVELGPAVDAVLVHKIDDQFVVNVNFLFARGTTSEDLQKFLVVYLVMGILKNHLLFQYIFVPKLVQINEINLVI